MVKYNKLSRDVNKPTPFLSAVGKTTIHSLEQQFISVVQGI
jgi:hypothetical protein